MVGGDGDRVRAPKRHKSSAPSKAALVDESAEMDYADDFDDDAGDADKEVKKRDFTKLELKPDHANRPLWACADGRIVLETFSPLYKQTKEESREAILQGAKVLECVRPRYSMQGGDGDQGRPG